MTDKDFVAEFGSFQEVLDGFATHLSEEGVFFENGGAGVVGSAVPFEVRIRNGFSVLRGEGEIVQATEDGVFLRLVNLDPASLKLLPKLLEHYRKRGVPLLELPEPTSRDIGAEADDSPPDESPAVEVVAEEISTEEGDKTVEPAPGLTLDDLEAEFLTEGEPEDAASEANDGEVPDEAIQVEAEEVGAQSDFSEDDESVDSEESAPNDIHLNELMAEDDATRLEVPEEALSIPDTDLEDLQVDSGLPWLPDETEKSGNKGLWVVLLAIVLGALLGVAFYFGYLRPRASTSWLPVEPESVEARAVPAGASLLQPTAAVAAVNGHSQDADAGAASQPQTMRESTQGEPQPQAHDPPGDRLTGVDRVTWANEAGETVITLWADGLFSAEQVDDFRVAGGMPREVVRVRGVQRPFPQQQIELGGEHVLQIRVGLHEEAGGAALHFVADLVDSEVRLSKTEAAGEQLRVYFSKAG